MLTRKPSLRARSSRDCQYEGLRPACCTAERREPLLDALCRHVLQDHRAERRQQLRPDEDLVTRHRRPLALTVKLDVAQPLRRRIGKGGAGAHLANECPATRLR
jgi:hypothetical protein